ncbi:MAG: hypothetical protein KGS72_17510 [Cyanobacteria bacterium REEB67]|nr:hypothetical protein [Cyanobacteria bacterium REEB67]
MKSKIRLFFLGCAFAATSFLSAQAAGAANIEDVDTARLSQIVQSNAGAIVVEFYDPAAIGTDADSSGECARQQQIFENVAAEYAGQVTFLRFDIRQDPALAKAGRLVVCPTHLFILNHFPDPTAAAVPNRTPFRHWGLLSQSQFEELIGEFFQIARPTP